MNLYVRYFDFETVVEGADTAYQFLCEAVGEALDIKFLDSLREYVDSDIMFTKRIKYKAHCYFIVIKTDTQNIEEFKERGKLMAQEKQSVEPNAIMSEKEAYAAMFSKENPGWYETSMLFRRVVLNEQTGKNEYVDVEFAVRQKAHNIKEAYDRMIAYVKGREDVDKRSQLPSIKSTNFNYKFLGMNPETQVIEQ